MSAVSKIVLFDLDATLTCHRTAFAQWAQGFAEESGVPVHWLMETEERWAGRRAAFFDEVQRTFGIGRSVLSMQSAYRRRTAELVPFRPEVCEALDRLAGEGWRMGLVTNGEAAAQRTKLHRAGLDRFFPSGVVISSEIGLRKPDPALFRLALDDLGARNATAYVVGDDLQADIHGALAARLIPVWVSHGRQLDPEDPQPAHVAESVVEAIEWLRTAATQNLPSAAA
ncbi:HAD family hydrolase [Streptomyces hesseae]|uniref:HAD family hydrolase n=1 Tax=Streptomyces hesseae TaxID=3075519 RepID=A0ABU2SY39_9ACTN|nr:HAD family hydrolase [Streptomyces sp. DSM 40473]MDT0453772.1 HAD family hydrolase [Streptomyces sp. DSM 40473]